MSDALTLDEAATQAWTDLMGPVDDNPEAEEAAAEGTVEDPDDNGDDAGDEDDDLDDELEEDLEDDDEDSEDLDDGDDEDEEDDAQATPDVIELSEDDVIRLPNGEQIAVSEAVLFQAGATKKYQELAEQRKELEAKQAEAEQAYADIRQWVDDRASNPVGFAREIIGHTPDKTYAVAVLLKEMAEAGELDPAFVETFGLKAGKVAETADQAQERERLSAVERQLAEQRQREVLAARQQELVNHYLGQWNEVKTGKGLAFESAAAERAAWSELVNFAHENQIVDLRHAYVVMQNEKQGAATQQPSKKDPAVAKRKRAQRVVARKSTGGGGKADEKPKGPVSVEDAIASSLAELRTRGA